MHILMVVLVCASLLAIPELYSRTVGVRTAPTAPVIARPAVVRDDSKVEEKSRIVATLEEALVAPELDNSRVSNSILKLAQLDPVLADTYLKKIFDKLSASSVPIVPMPNASGSISEPVKPVTPVAPSSAEPMKKGTPPAPPGAKPINTGIVPPAPGMQKGTPPPPPAPGGIKKGGTPPPPPGPMPKGGKKAETSSAKPTAPVVAPKGPQPLSIREAYGAKQLSNRSEEEVIKLFNDLLDALGTYPDFWDAVKKEPKLDWQNKIGSVEKDLVKRNTGLNTKTLISDRIKRVRTDKAKQGLEKQAAADAIKKSDVEVYNESDLIKEIDALKRNADTSDFQWLIKFRGSVAKLNTINHEKALEYEQEFIKRFPDQKPFLPKGKKIVVPKELTKEESLMADIDKILQEKQGFWFVKVRNPIQELYDIDPDLGLKYQDKYIEESSKASGKPEKPFLIRK